MGENKATTNYRMRRIGGGLVGFGAAAVAMIMVLSPMASAASAATLFPHSTASLSWDVYENGCATAKVAKPGISLTTGVGHASMSSKAKTCSHNKGGSKVDSYSDASNGVGITENIKLTKAASMVNITLNIRAIATVAAAGNLPAHCPVTTDSGSYSFSNTTVWYNDSYAYCSAEASWEIYAEPEVEDLTTHTYYSQFASMGNESGNYYDYYNDTTNYSNPYYTNVSYSGVSTYSFGTPYTTHIAWNPSLVMTGTFNLGDHLEIFADIYIYTDTEVEYESHGNAAASFLASGASGHVDISSITVS